MSAKRTQLFLLLGAVVLFVLLFIAPKAAPKKESASAAASGKKVPFDNASLELYVNMAQKALEPERKKQLDEFSAAKSYDSIAGMWDRLKRPDIAAYYIEKQAANSNTAEKWLKAGSRYYYAVQFTPDKTEVPVLYQCAMRSFSKALSLDPKNSEAKIMLASCYVEGTESPMDGISLLREVEKTDSNNVKLQLAFAFFSVKSGQLDRAISRFNKVLAVDSNYIEAYLHLADAYEQQGQSEKTIEMLEKYSRKTQDVTARVEIEKYIQQLKTNTNK